MTPWRILVAVFLLVLLAAPALAPFVDLLHHAAGWRVWLESGRLLALAGNTLGLVAGTIAVALPLGVVGAILLYRTDLPGRPLWRFLTVLSLFVPLPLFTSAWQATLGTTGLFPVAGWRTPVVGAPPWAQGLGAAVWIHAVASLPWVVLLVGLGLQWVERELEEDALTLFPWWRVLWLVTLPRCRAALAAAAVWVALQTATEITVTDMMQVRTFAEEVYTQFVRPELDPTLPNADDVLARAVAVSLPAFLITWALIAWAAVRWDRSLPPLGSRLGPPVTFSLGWLRWPCLAGVVLVAGLLAGVPLTSLIWKTGLEAPVRGGPAPPEEPESAGASVYSPPVWSVRTTGKYLARTFRVRGSLVGESLLLAAAAGAASAGLALLVCWLALDARWFRLSVLSLMAVLWAMPGPVLGLGLKDAIAGLLDVTGSSWLAGVLYYGPSPVPVLWAYLLRFFPYAVAILWPVVRMLPPELRDAERIYGTGPGHEFRHLILPLSAGGCLLAALAVAVLSLGELSAGKLVETPGSQTFAHEVFTEMHYGLTNNLAALCLILLLAVLLGGTVVAVLAGRRANHGGQG
jgi:iron(III) transport system permease protein